MKWFKQSLKRISLNRLLINACLVILVTITPLQASSTYWQEYQTQLKAEGVGPKLEKFIQDGAVTQLNNPDYYAAAANYWSNVSESVLFSTKPAANGDLVVAEEKTGKPVGSISTEGTTNPEYQKKALTILIEGMSRFPWRADIALGLAYGQLQAGQLKACTETLISFLSTAKKAPDALRWMGNASLPRPAQEFIPDSVYDDCVKLYDLKTPEGDALCDQICETLARNYPNNPKPPNLLAALAEANGKPEDSLRWLQKAYVADPHDALVLLNMGDASARLGKKKEALEIYKKVIELPNAEQEYKNDAKDSIRKLQTP